MENYVVKFGIQFPLRIEGEGLRELLERIGDDKGGIAGELEGEFILEGSEWELECREYLVASIGEDAVEVVSQYFDWGGWYEDCQRRAGAEVYISEYGMTYIRM